MIIQKNNRINYSLFHSNAINSKMRNIKWFKNFYFKINNVSQCFYIRYAGPLASASSFLYSVSHETLRSFYWNQVISSQDSNFISKSSKKKVNQILTRNSIKKKNLIPYSNKNFKVYFLFIIFYFDKVRSNIISPFIFYNFFVRSFKFFTTEEVNKSDKPIQDDIPNNLNHKEFNIEGSKLRYNEKKDSQNILRNIENYPRPIDFFRILKKSTTCIRCFSFTPFHFKILYKSTHYSANSETFMNKKVKLIRVLKAEKEFEESAGLTLKYIRINLSKNGFIHSDLNFYKTIIKNIIDSEISFYKIVLSYAPSLNLFNLFLINLIERSCNLDYFQYKNKLEKFKTVKFKSSVNEFIWYYKCKQNKVIYIFNKVLTLISFSGCKGRSSLINFFENNAEEKPFLNISNYYYLNILIIKQDKNLPYSLKIIYLNLHSRVWSFLKFILTRFFYFLFNFNSRSLTMDVLKIKGPKIIKKYILTLNSQKQISSGIKKSIKKSKKYKIKNYLNQGLWQLNKKDHNQNSLKWIFNKYWLNINYSVIISKNLTIYYSFKSNNINLLNIFFNKIFLTKKMDANFITKTFFFKSNFLNHFEIRYKVYLRKLGIKQKNFVSLTPQKKAYKFEVRRLICYTIS